MDIREIDPTPDLFSALARSSPWRWRSLRFEHLDHEGTLEAWLERPGRLAILTSGGRLEFHHSELTPPTYIFVGDGPRPTLPAPVWGMDLEPERRPDGLVAARPEGGHIQYDDPMHHNYTWVAMLDPEELSHHVEITDPTRVENGGRVGWQAILAPLDGYEARCAACCDLLMTEVAMRQEEHAPGIDLAALPTAFEVTLDVQTAVVTSLVPVDGRRDDLWFHNRIIEVDTDLSEVFEA